ncbi:uncharacterized protein K452DRAFT_199711, partial [Aplosporella prunicola CBS 121167]
WVWELGGMIISIGCMVTMLILLPYLDHKPVDEWHFLIAPNTMISTLITISKTSMLLTVAEGLSQLKWLYFKTAKRSLPELDIFDGASRGPWGALIFVSRMSKKTGVILPVIGSVVMIASLTMEPFAQQI